MIRVVVFLIVVGLLALGVAWLADRPGEVVLTWQGLHIETSLMVLGVAMLALMAALALTWRSLSAVPSLAVHAAPASASSPRRARL